MPALNCNFRIEEVQGIAQMDPFESDDADNDSLIDEVLTLENSEYSNHTWDYSNDDLTSGESGSSDDESTDEGSDDRSENSDKVSNARGVPDFDVDAVSHQLCKMDSEQCELAQNLIAAILHEGVMGRLTRNTVLKDLPTEENNAVLDDTADLS